MGLTDETEVDIPSFDMTQDRKGFGTNPQGTTKSASDVWSEPPDDAKTLQIKRPDPLASTVVMSNQTTMTIDTKEFTAAGLVLPFQSAAPNTTPISVSSAMSPRPGEFTGTVSLSIADVLRAATPFDQPQPAASPMQVMAPNTSVPAPSNELPAFQAHLSVPKATPPAPGRTIGEAAVAGGFPVPAAPVLGAQPLGADVTQTAIHTTAPPQDVVVLCYLNRPGMQRIVRKPAWQKILDALEDVPIDPETDDPALSSDPAEIQEQTQAYAILKQGHCIDRDTAIAALDAAANKAGRFAPPLELFEGELEPSLDHIELLRALISIVPAFVSCDERLQSTLDTATTFLATPGATYAPPLIYRHYTDIRQAYTSGKHLTTIDEIDRLITRTLLEQRHYQERRVLGAVHIRAILHCFGQSQPFVVYIPNDSASNLPLTATFRARLLAEVHYAQDEQEKNSIALRTLALANVMRRVMG